ncbi:MAG: DUF4476 domain-containing protein [Chitinophagaceae bacterium]
MKTIFTLVTSLLMSIAVFAAAKPKGILTVKSTDNADIRIVLDGKRFEPNHNSIMLRGIDDGYHTIKIFRERSRGFFGSNGKRYELVYNNSIRVKRNTHLFITVERNGRISMQENRIKKDWDRQDRDWDNARNNDRDRNNSHGRDDRNEKDYDFEGDGQWDDYDNNEGYASGMNDREFKTVLTSIDKEWLESNKFKSASQIVRSNSLTTAQVEQILLLFSVENNKLELAKQAYANTVDKNNYSRLYDVFSFNSSKKELERYIRR